MFRDVTQTSTYSINNFHYQGSLLHCVETARLCTHALTDTDPLNDSESPTLSERPSRASALHQKLLFSSSTRFSFLELLRQCLSSV
uniref:Uncharacterized protein U18 n=1 Tax=Hyposoter didymator TaxID=260305 RepID=D7P5P7_HYPDD|nr:unknown [Hyposoter didymator]